jgi:hypothetical protein
MMRQRQLYGNCSNVRPTMVTGTNGVIRSGELADAWEEQPMTTFVITLTDGRTAQVDCDEVTTRAAGDLWALRAVAPKPAALVPRRHLCRPYVAGPSTRTALRCSGWTSRRLANPYAQPEPAR